MRKLLLAIILCISISTNIYAGDNKISLITKPIHINTESDGYQKLAKIICVDGYKYLIVYSLNEYIISAVQMFQQVGKMGSASLPVKCNE